MLRYELGPTKATQASAVDTLLWEQMTIPAGSQVKGVSFIQTGTAHDLDSIASLKFKKGGTDFVSFANDLQIMAYCNSLGKKVIATSVARWSIPFQNVYGWPLNFPMLGAPADAPLSIELVTDGTGSTVGTVTPVFWIDDDPKEAGIAYPQLVSQSLATGTPSNTAFEVSSPGMLHGFIIDTTNVTALRFNYLGQDIWNFSSLAQLFEVQELWQGTTVETNRAVYLPKPVPVVSGRTKLIVTGSGAVGQVIPIILVPNK
jgi:hypothetical protein